MSEERVLIPGTLRGFRQWNLTNRALFPVTIYRSRSWVPGWNRAVHVGAHEFPDHRPPEVNCRCGFYAHYNLYQGNPGRVTGVIEVAGRVQLHQTGFRAERARIVALSPPERMTERGIKFLMQQIGAVYGVPVMDLNQLAREYPDTDMGSLVPPREPEINLEEVAREMLQHEQEWVRQMVASWLQTQEKGGV